MGEVTKVGEPRGIFYTSETILYDDVILGYMMHLQH